jgi:hypothetical protein
MWQAFLYQSVMYQGRSISWLGISFPLPGAFGDVSHFFHSARSFNSPDAIVRQVTNRDAEVYAVHPDFDYHQSVMAIMAPPARPKKTPSPESRATVKQTPGAKGDEMVRSGSLQSEPAYDEIARLAYNYWLDRKDTGEGSPEQDWLRAEEELRGDRPVR